MSKKQKLELTWVGKEKRTKLEPRILIEDPSKSYHAQHKVSENDIFDNMLIHGDNLLALKALEQDYTGRIKCIYIDPPFNTQQAFEYYDDGLEHSIWLDLMYQRLGILHSLLTDDGLIWIHLDDSEVHYLKVIMDEIFGRDKFVSHISYERSGAAGIGQGGFFVDTSEHILVYKKNTIPQHSEMNSCEIELKTIKRYNKYLNSFGKKKLIREFTSKSNNLPVKVFEYEEHEVGVVSLKGYEKKKDEIDKELATHFNFLFRTNQIQKENSFQKDLVNQMDKSKLYSVVYTPSRGKYKDEGIELFYLNAELFSWLKDTATLQDGKIVKHTTLTNFWKHEDIPKADIANEGGVKFSRGKKPEQLLKRIISISSKPGDIVLDSFLGSGTTAATAHKMNRKWIGIELGEHCQTLCKPRLENVVNGRDVGGVSKSTNWKGGGGFRFFELGPTLIKEDSWGNLVINSDFNPNMLAEAMCKLEGFKYSPSDEIFWVHGQSSEKDFIYVTTQFLTKPMLEKLSDDVGPDRSLLVCCSAFKGNPDDYSNLTIKKIPNAVLKKCEWGHDDYSLEIKNLPELQFEEDQPNQVIEKKRKKPLSASKSTLEQPNLFDNEEE